MYKVGDKVKIKSLEKLKDEFLTDCRGNIKTECTLLRNKNEEIHFYFLAL